MKTELESKASKSNHDLIYRCVVCNEVSRVAAPQNYSDPDPRCSLCKSLLVEKGLIDNSKSLGRMTLDILRNNFIHVLFLLFILLIFVNVLGDTLPVSGTNVWFQVMFAYILGAGLQKSVVG